jgi:hypothetical protein
MARSPAVLLLDDGELDDVQQLLDDLGVSYGRVRGGAIPDHSPAPTRLLVATPRRIAAVDTPPAGSEDDLMRLVVVSEDSPTLRARLREVGFDYLVRRPVHPEALRLLLLHCLYAGDERRREPRVPVGFEVSFRMGLLPRRATLADLSTRGCRILSKWGLEPGKRITVTIPQRAGVPDAVTLKGRVVRMSLDERLGTEGPYSAAVAFDELTAELRHELEWILEERARGPATLRPEEPPPDGDEAAPGDSRPELDPPETRAEDLTRGFSVEVDVRMEAGPSPPQNLPEPEPTGEPRSEKGGNGAQRPERRRGPRGAYPRQVPAFGDRAMRVLVARDLSMGGMRIEKDAGLEIGDRLHLAIYGAADEEPFLVWATVQRDDDGDSLALVFDEVHAVVAEQLEKVVADLPAVESLHDDEARAMGTVVSEILDH